MSRYSGRSDRTHLLEKRKNVCRSTTVNLIIMVAGFSEEKEDGTFAAPGPQGHALARRGSPARCPWSGRTPPCATSPLYRGRGAARCRPYAPLPGPAAWASIHPRESGSGSHPHPGEVIGSASASAGCRGTPCSASGKSCAPVQLGGGTINLGLAQRATGPCTPRCTRRQTYHQSWLAQYTHLVIHPTLATYHWYPGTRARLTEAAQSAIEPRRASVELVPGRRVRESGYRNRVIQYRWE